MARLPHDAEGAARALIGSKRAHCPPFAELLLELKVVLRILGALVRELEVRRHGRRGTCGCCLRSVSCLLAPAAARPLCRHMDAPDHQKEARLLSTPKELEKGLPLVEKKDPSRGRVIFSLGELPFKVVYLTPLGNTLERVSHTDVMFRGADLVREHSLRFVRRKHQNLVRRSLGTTLSRASLSLTLARNC